MTARPKTEIVKLIKLISHVITMINISCQIQKFNLAILQLSKCERLKCSTDNNYMKMHFGTFLVEFQRNFFNNILSDIRFSNLTNLLRKQILKYILYINL